jgi:sugar phosphate isomerase/epimerase
MKIGTRMPPFANEVGFEKYANWLGENGFEAVDTPPITADIARICAANRLEIGSCDATDIGILSKDASVRRKALSQFKTDVSAIKRFGGHTCFVVLSPDNPSQTRQTSFEIFSKIYPKVVEHAEREGVRIAIEPYPGPAPYYSNLGCTPESLRRIFEIVPSANLGICYDPSHFARIQIDYLRLLHEFGDRVHHVHLKDTEIVSEQLYETGILGETHTNSFKYGEGWWRYTIPGEGEVDWNQVVRRLEEIGYDGVLSIELEDHHFFATTELQQEGILRSREYIEQFLKGS